MNRTIFLSSKRRVSHNKSQIFDILQMDKDIRTSQYSQITIEQFEGAVGILEQIDLSDESFFNACLCIRQYYYNMTLEEHHITNGGTHQTYYDDANSLSTRMSNSFIIGKYLTQIRYIQSLLLSELKQFTQSKSAIQSRDAGIINNPNPEHLTYQVLYTQLKKLKEIYWITNYHTYICGCALNNSQQLIQLLSILTDRTLLEWQYRDLICSPERDDELLILPFDGYLLYVQSLQCNIYTNILYDYQSTDAIIKQSKLKDFVIKNFNPTLWLLQNQNAKRSIPVQEYLQSYLNLFYIFINKCNTQLQQLKDLIETRFGGYLDMFTEINPQILDQIIKICITYFQQYTNISILSYEIAYSDIVLPVLQHKELLNLHVIFLTSKLLYELLSQWYYNKGSRNIFQGIQEQVCALFQYLEQYQVPKEYANIYKILPTLLLQLSQAHCQIYQWCDYQIKEILLYSMTIQRKIGILSHNYIDQLIDLLKYHIFTISQFDESIIVQLLDGLAFIFQAILNYTIQKSNKYLYYKHSVIDIVNFLQDTIFQNKAYVKSDDDIGAKYVQYMRECGIIDTLNQLCLLPEYNNDISLYSFLELVNEPL